MTTQTAKAEGHYEINTGDGWKQVEKGDLERVANRIGLLRGIDSPLVSADEVIQRWPGIYRYVEGGPS